MHLKCKLALKHVRLRYLYFVKIRFYATKSPFSSTVFLPVSSFPARGKIDSEIKIQNKESFKRLYEWQQIANKDNPKFILHDGPPYANGEVHVGHAVNKILKDITNRYKLLRGYCIDYIPGWDCHGLPIEIKAQKELKKDFSSMEALEVREVSQKFAENTIKNQKNSFERWGVMADWENNCYYTYSKQYESKELQAFFEIYKNGFVYRALMPVYWSPSSKTALAESELEYVEDHNSKSVYASFYLTKIPGVLKSNINCNGKIKIIIWTTQPWTLATNEAVCYSEKVKYCLVKDANEANDIEKYYIVCENQLDKLCAILDKQFTVIHTFDGNELKGIEYFHPINSSESRKLLPSDHVAMDKGTGFVHISPAHGHDDFNIATKNNLRKIGLVDDSGRFTDDCGIGLKGKFIFTSGNDSVVDFLGNNNLLLKVYQHTHSYPYDWRTKKPIFIKASEQWFIDVKTLHEKVNNAISSVKIYPDASKNGIFSEIGLRTYWCISRQRVWGVPIPVFYHKHSKQYILNNESIEHICNLVKIQGSNCWWNLQIEELLPQHVLDASGFSSCQPTDFVKGTDILDIWFDSGISWLSVLGGNQQSTKETPVADLYLEGKDQFGGWYLSSLMTSIAINNCAPYKNIVTHGFVIAESDKKKMSKSVGNVIAPDKITDGDQYQNSGANLLRWWVAHSNTFNDIKAGAAVFTSCSESMKKLRQRLKFMLGCLSDFKEDNLVTDVTEMHFIDRYFLYLLDQYVNDVTLAYDQFNYYKVAEHMTKFLSSTSNIYFTIIKDRQYCGYGKSRRSCQTTLYHLLNNINTSLAPILPYLAEEVLMHHPCTKLESVFRGGWCNTHADWRDTKTVQHGNFLMQIRQNFLSLIKGEDPELFDICLQTTDKFQLDLNKLQSNNFSAESELCEIFGCSHLSVCPVPTLSGKNSKSDQMFISDDNTFALIVQKSVLSKCPRCRKYTSDKVGQPCKQCFDTIGEAWSD